jgi:hypothetical protein
MTNKETYMRKLIIPAKALLTVAVVVPEVWAMPTEDETPSVVEEILPGAVPFSSTINPKLLSPVSRILLGVPELDWVAFGIVPIIQRP